MKHHLPSLEALKVFESAGRHLSFSLAADELCITKGAVSYQVRKLEESLDCALFRRSIRQVYLTDSGQQLMHTTQQLFAELGRTLEQIRPAGSSRDVRVGATTYVALRWLSPRISIFSESNPEVSILLQHSVNSEAFSLRDVDFVIRWDKLAGKAKKGLLLELPMPLFPVCSPRLLERYGITAEAGKLARVDLIREPLGSAALLCEDRGLDLWQAWYGDETPRLGNPRRIIADANVRTQAAIDAQGWTLADSLMRAELTSGALIAPFEHRLTGYGYAIQSYPGRYISRESRAFRDWLVGHARQQGFD